MCLVPRAFRPREQWSRRHHHRVMHETPMSDAEIESRVRLELEWTPDLDHTRLHVRVTDGTVVLSGEVDDVRLVAVATEAAHRVRGTRAVVRRIRVFNPSMRLNDSDVAAEVVARLDRRPDLSSGDIHVTVTHGCVHLAGVVAWNEQKAAAEALARSAHGVRTVIDALTVDPDLGARATRHHITSSLQHDARVEGESLSISASGDGHVVVEGVARSDAERAEILSAVGSVDGVTGVDDELAVAPTDGGGQAR